MRTNFSQRTFLVLTNEDSKVIAIINCPAGLSDISEQINTAICDDYDSKEVIINAVIVNGIETLNPIGDYDFYIDFKADILCPDYDVDTETFNLIRTEIY